MKINGRTEMLRSVERNYHSGVLETTNSLERHMKRKELIAELYDYILTKEAGFRVSSLINDTIKKNLKLSPETWNPEQSAAAFTFLEEYAWHLYDNPWKPELRYIKVYTGMMQVNVKPYVPNLESILGLLGYKETPKGFKLKSGTAADKEALLKAAVHCFIGHIECTIMTDLLQKVNLYALNAYHVYECRVSFKGSLQDCVGWLKRKHNIHVHERPVMIETTSHLADDMVGFSEKSKTTGIGARPKEPLARQHNINVNNGRNSSRMLTSRSVSHEEFQNVSENRCSGVNDADLYGVDIKDDEHFEDYYKPATFEDHLKESLSTLGSDVLMQKSRSPIDIEGWELVQNRKHQNSKNHIRSDPIPIEKRQDDATRRKLLHKKFKTAELSSSSSSESRRVRPNGNKASASSSSYGITYPPVLLPSVVHADCAHDAMNPEKTAVNVATVDDRNDSSFALYREGVQTKGIGSSSQTQRTAPQHHKESDIYSDLSEHEVLVPVDTNAEVRHSDHRRSIYDNVPYPEDTVRSYLQDSYHSTSDVIKSDELYTSTSAHNSHQSLPVISNTASKTILSKVKKNPTDVMDVTKGESDFCSQRPKNQYRQPSNTSVTTQSMSMSVCRHCTVFIPVGSNVCEVCGRSQERDSTLLPKPGGTQCPSCTLINKLSARRCAACKTLLIGSYTYV